MPYFEVETDTVTRCLIKASSYEDVILKLRDQNIDEDSIMQISRCHYNLVLV